MKESEIRPKELFNKYLELSLKDGELLDREFFVKIPCPSCGLESGKEKIVKNGFAYVNCENCNSLYCSPRPSAEQLDELYSDSESSKYWSTVFFPTVQEARKEKIFQPKAERIYNFISNRDIKINNICDIGAGHGFFLDELSKKFNGSKLFAIEPDKNSAKVCEGKGIEVLVSTAEKSDEWKDKFDLVISSEVIEHVYDPRKFVKSLYDLLNDEGYLLLTGLGYEGFDILMLQEESKSISPPHHINFFSIEGFKKLFSSVGFSEVEVWTPGVLDVDIVLNSQLENDFLEVLRLRGDDMLAKFQNFLSENNLSSHVWVFAKK